MVSPGLRVILNCVCDTPRRSALPSRVYLGNVQRRERNPAGRGDGAQGGGGWGGSFSFFFFFLFLSFSRVTDISSRGSGRSELRQSQRSSDLVRNAAVLYLFLFFPPAFCQSQLRLAAALVCLHTGLTYGEGCLKGQGEGLSLCLWSWRGSCVHSL